MDPSSDLMLAMRSSLSSHAGQDEVIPSAPQGVEEPDAFLVIRDVTNGALRLTGTGTSVYAKACQHAGCKPDAIRSESLFATLKALRTEMVYEELSALMGTDVSDFRARQSKFSDELRLQILQPGGVHESNN